MIDRFVRCLGYLTAALLAFGALELLVWSNGTVLESLVLFGLLGLSAWVAWLSISASMAVRRKRGKDFACPRNSVSPRRIRARLRISVCCAVVILAATLGIGIRWMLSPAPFNDFDGFSIEAPSPMLINRLDVYDPVGVRIETIPGRLSGNNGKLKFTFYYRPMFLLCAVGVVACGIFVFKYGRQLRETLPGNLCRNCGYDLRASGPRCPECGTVRSI